MGNHTSVSMECAQKIFFISMLIVSSKNKFYLIDVYDNEIKDSGNDYQHHPGPGSGLFPRLESVETCKYRCEQEPECNAIDYHVSRDYICVLKACPIPFPEARYQNAGGRDYHQRSFYRRNWRPLPDPTQVTGAPCVD